MWFIVQTVGKAGQAGRVALLGPAETCPLFTQNRLK